MISSNLDQEEDTVSPRKKNNWLWNSIILDYHRVGLRRSCGTSMIWPVQLQSLMESLDENTKIGILIIKMMNR